MAQRDNREADSEFEQLSLAGLDVPAPEQSWPEPCDRSPLVKDACELSLQDLPEGYRPRDRLLKFGSAALSTEELLTILLGASQAGNHSPPLSLGQRLLQVLSVDGLEPVRGLREIAMEELTAVSGIGPAKAAIIVAAVELGKRAFLQKPETLPVVSDPSVAVEALAQDLMWQSQERFAVVLLDITHRLLGTQVVTIGTATETLAHPREVFRVAIKRGATRIIIAHNHPSGVLEPSPDDLALTKQFLQAAEVLGVPVLDHLILGAGQYRSLRETTNLWHGKV